MTKENKSVIDKLNLSKLDKLGIGNIRRGLKMKFITAIVVSLLISPTIASFIYNLINSSGLVPGSYAVIISTAINLVVVTTIVLFLVTRFVIKPLNEVISVGVAISEGDLTKQSAIKNQDEIGQLAKAINASVVNMNQVLTDIRGMGENVAELSENLSTMTSDYGQSIEQVAVSINEAANDNSNQSIKIMETSATLKELSSAISNTATSAFQIKDSAQGTLDKALEGEKAVDRTITEMESITNHVRDSVLEVNNLKEHIEKIEDILNTISAISTQTNLLALNAAIEAARAGEQGKGFAVVAEEVRKLAEESAGATVEIGTIIKDIVVRANGTASMIDNISKEVDQGSKVVKEMGTIFKSIMGAVETNVEDVITINNLTDSQAKSSDELVISMDNIASVSQNVAAVFEQVAASTQEQSATLSEIAKMAQQEAEVAESLRHKISAFKLN